MAIRDAAVNILPDTAVNIVTDTAVNIVKDAAVNILPDTDVNIVNEKKTCGDFQSTLKISKILKRGLNIWRVLNIFYQYVMCILF